MKGCTRVDPSLSAETRSRPGGLSSRCDRSIPAVRQRPVRSHLSMRTALRRQLLHFATDLTALVENPDDLPHGFDLLTRSYVTPAADAARAFLRGNPAIRSLIEERYWGHWPALDELLSMPPDSLGHRYGALFGAAGLQALPDPVLADDSDAEETWLHLRVRHTHDLWHVVTGCPTTAAGEAAISAVNVMQLRWPGSAMLLGADLMHRCLAGSDPQEVDVGLAVAFGLELGQRCAPLLAQRWEDGWQRSVSDWQEQLGITALLTRSPFRSPG